jgi:hypothetical protein
MMMMLFLQPRAVMMLLLQPCVVMMLLLQPSAVMLLLLQPRVVDVVVVAFMLTDVDVSDSSSMLRTMMMLFQLHAVNDDDGAIPTPCCK